MAPEGRLLRRFGKEQDPERVELLQQARRWQATAGGVLLIGIFLWVQVSIFLGLPLVVAGVSVFGYAVNKFVLAFRGGAKDSGDVPGDEEGEPTVARREQEANATENTRREMVFGVALAIGGMAVGAVLIGALGLSKVVAAAVFLPLVLVACLVFRRYERRRRTGSQAALDG